MNDINKRYNIGLSIINNSGGFKAMLNDIIKPSRIIKSYKIYNRLKSIINKVFENVGYFFIGYKVDIELNQSDILEAKSKIRILRSNQSKNLEDIQTLINLVNKNVSKTETLGKYVSKKFVKVELEMANTEQIKTLTKDVKVLRKPAKKKIDKNLFKLDNIVDEINNIINIKVSNAWRVGHYGEDITQDEEPKRTIKNILEDYINLTNERGQDGTK